MSAKSVWFWTLVMTVLSLGTVRGQTLPGKYGKDEGVPPVSQPAPLPGDMIQEPAALSDWVTYRRGGCCMGPIGGDTPMGTELYVRVGPSVPIGGDLGKVLQTGWAIQGGLRALFYNQAHDAAWFLDGSLSNYANDANGPDLFPLTFAGGGTKDVTVRAMNRTFVNLGLGREVYLLGTAKDAGLKWRIGGDAGWRYGSGRVELNEIRHRTDVMGGAFVAAFSDVECPWGCCVLTAGFRTEWSYTWSDIMQSQSDVQDINLLLTVGVRY